MIPKICQFKDGLDPDSVLNKYGLESLKEDINKSQDFFAFVFQYFKKIYGFSNPTEQTKVTYHIAEMLGKLTNTIQQAFYIQELAYKLKISEKNLTKIIRQNTTRTYQKEDNPIPVAQSKITDPLEFAILELSLSSREVGEKLAEYLTKITFTQTPVGILLNEILGLIQIGKWEQAQQKIQETSSSTLPEIAPIIINNQYSNILNDQKRQAINQTITKVLIQQKEKQLDTIYYQLKKPKLTPQENKQLLHEITKINKERQRIKQQTF